MKYPFIPPTSEGSGGINKTVTFTVSVASLPDGAQLHFLYSSVYILNDAANLKEAAEAIRANMPYDGMTQSAETLQGTSSPVTIENVEINTGKRIVILTRVMTGFLEFQLMAKEIDASAISGNTHEVTLAKEDLNPTL